MRLSRSAAIKVALMVVLVQHGLIYWPHYLGVDTFIKDFYTVYYPLTNFWIALVEQGIFPEWQPFANMGLPLVLTMQSGIFYPPFWLFAFSEQFPYTLSAANILQALHILFGALGCWCYGRLQGLSVGAACFAAVAFQFFGGFYSNAEHPDIIRAFAYIPWLFWSVHIPATAQVLSTRNLAVPVILALFVTAAYQGNLISQLLVLVVFCVLSWLQTSFQQKAWHQQMKLYGQLLGLGLCGLALAAVYLVPTWELKSFLTRIDGVSGVRFNWHFSYWHSLIMFVDREGTFVWRSMISAFVTVPVFCLLFLVTGRFMKDHWPWVCVVVLSVLLAAGESFPLYPWLISEIPVLGYSRFPSSDYRGLFGFGLVILAGKLLDDFSSQKWSGIFWRRAWLCLGLLFYYYFFGLVSEKVSSLPEATVKSFAEKYPGLSTVGYIILFFHDETIALFNPNDWLIVLVLAVLAMASMYYLRKKPGMLAVSLIILALISGGIQLKASQPHWRQSLTDQQIYTGVNFYQTLPVVEQAKRSLERRPVCETGETWLAYLRGNYICTAKDYNNTKPRAAVSRSAILEAYMQEPSQAILLDEGGKASCQESVTKRGNQHQSPIQYEEYGLGYIRYRVSAQSNFCFVENELFYPGWSGKIEEDAITYTPQLYCEALRSWCLPKGDYQFQAHYETPGLHAGMMISVLALAIYLVILGCYFCLRKK